MPIYMDVHIVPGVKAKDVAEAHRKDLLHQGEFGCNCMTYWIDEKRDSIFCLIEASDKDAVKEMHSKAHGLVPNKIIEVSSSVVESFLGRIYDPEDAAVTGGLKVFADPSFRILVVVRTHDPLLLQHEWGEKKADELLARLHELIRRQIGLHQGSEVEHQGDGFIISFTSATHALVCALAIQQELPPTDATTLGLRIGINGGEPVGNSNTLFGDTIHLANHLCSIASPSQIAVSSKVKELASRELYQKNKTRLLDLSPQEENFLENLFQQLAEKWQDPEFGIEDYCSAVAMSKSQLYRKITSLTGMSGNTLLKEYRLEKARELMKKRQFSISQITFETGFSSPSYFTKCFKKKFGLLPNAYLEKLK